MNDDFYYEKPSKWQIFTRFILPWFVLAAICIGIFLAGYYLLSAASEIFKAIEIRQ